MLLYGSDTIDLSLLMGGLQALLLILTSHFISESQLALLWKRGDTCFTHLIGRLSGPVMVHLDYNKNLWTGYWVSDRQPKFISLSSGCWKVQDYHISRSKVWWGSTFYFTGVNSSTVPFHNGRGKEFIWGSSSIKVPILFTIASCLCTKIS